MAISTGEIVMLVILLLIFSVAIWYLVVALIYRNEVNKFEHARGANRVGAGFVNFECENGKVISVDSAISVCSGMNMNNDDNKYTEINNNIYIKNINDPVSKHSDRKYGSFNFDDKNSGVQDLTKTIKKDVDGKTSYQYEFKPGQCNIQGTVPQLIATYTCKPKSKK